MDLKAAFDNIRREKLWSIIEEIEIEKHTIRRVKKMYEDTRVTIRTEDGLTEAFSTKKGIRQEYVMSPLFFNLYIADLNRCMRKRGTGGIKLSNDRIWLLAYADDMIILAKNREGLMDIIDTLKKVLKDKELVLNTEKTKVIAFNRSGKEKLGKWKWENKELEEVKLFRYLGFTFNRKGKYKDHIKELERKGKLTTNKVWWLGERICKSDLVEDKCYLIIWLKM